MQYSHDGMSGFSQSAATSDRANFKESAIMFTNEKSREVEFKKSPESSSKVSEQSSKVRKLRIRVNKLGVIESLEKPTSKASQISKGKENDDYAPKFNFRSIKTMPKDNKRGRT